MSKALFIGGAADGKRLETFDDMDTVNVPVPSASKTGFTRLTALVPTYSVETYRRESIRCNQREWLFYVLNTIPPECAIDMLISRYAPKPTTTGESNDRINREHHSADHR